MTNLPDKTANITLSNQPEAQTPLTAVQFLERYAAGEKKFRQVQLKKADLKGTNLAGIDLRGSDLSYANLKETDLSHADLRETCLVGADFSKANLSRANLQGARLEKTNFKEANLTRASFEKAILEGAFLTKAIATRANFQGASLIGAHLNEADFNNANLAIAYLDGAYLIQTNLQRATLIEASLIGAFLSGAAVNGANFKGAYYTNKTNFDVSFDPASAGLRKVKMTTLEEVMRTFTYLGECAGRYVGFKMTARYWESSRPDCEWLQNFQVNASGQITFAGNLKEPLTLARLLACSQWSNAFIKSCSAIVGQFPSLVDPEQIEFFST
ncbi:MAG: pentapeptide repeat-containing protein [Hydrococcus sp. Prado102]|jgi:uncharacterized protein YjbI with pentapeptide repeats|nr:pentapeptide repeat-containing protein [Hydrococcus sp. Prado102]